MVIKGAIGETQLCTGNLIDVLGGSTALRDHAQQNFAAHVADGCGVCQLVAREHTDKNTLKPEQLSAGALALKDSDLSRHWEILGFKDLVPCFICRRSFPSMEYMTETARCRFCLATGNREQLEDGEVSPTQTISGEQLSLEM